VAGTGKTNQLDSKRNKKQEKKGKNCNLVPGTGIHKNTDFNGKTALQAIRMQFFLFLPSSGAWHQNPQFPPLPISGTLCYISSGLPMDPIGVIA
jgi:hypothetical protein